MLCEFERMRHTGHKKKEKQKKKMDKEAWKIEAIFAFVLDDTRRREAEIHLLRCAFCTVCGPGSVDRFVHTDGHTKPAASSI